MVVASPVEKVTIPSDAVNSIVEISNGATGPTAVLSCANALNLSILVAILTRLFLIVSATSLTDV